MEGLMKVSCLCFLEWQLDEEVFLTICCEGYEMWILGRDCLNMFLGLKILYGFSEQGNEDGVLWGEDSDVFSKTKEP